jgi:tight adherence protein B
MLLWLLLIGGVGALFLAFMAMRGPSASQTVKRRIELIKERHGDTLAGNAQAQIRKLFAARTNKLEGYASTLIPKPALLRKRLEMTGKEISLGKYALICLGIVAFVTIGLKIKGAPLLLALLLGLFFGIGDDTQRALFRLAARPADQLAAIRLDVLRALSPVAGTQS